MGYFEWYIYIHVYHQLYDLWVLKWDILRDFGWEHDDCTILYTLW